MSEHKELAASITAIVIVLTSMCIAMTLDQNKPKPIPKIDNVISFDKFVNELKAAKVARRRDK